MRTLVGPDSRWIRWTAAQRKLLSFTVGSGAGLLLDLGTFAVLVLTDVPALTANLISSALAITTVYFLVSRYSFRVRPALASYVSFIAWYAIEAVCVSAAISWLSHGGEVRALVTKCAFVPVTFSLNFLFGRWLFEGGAERFSGRMRTSFLRRHDPLRQPSRDAALRRLLGRPEVRRRMLIVASVTTLVVAVVLVPMTEATSFVAPGTRRGTVIEYGLRTSFLLFVWLATAFLVRFVVAVRARSERHRRWLRASLLSLGTNLLLLALIWPGFWIWDEFYVLQSVKAYSTDSWQGYLTNVFYSFGLYLFPSPIGILGLQLAVIAVIVGYAVSTLQAVLTRPWLGVLVAVPLLSFPVLLSNQYPLRLTMYGYLLLLLLTRLTSSARSRGSGSSVLALLGDSLLVGVLAFWRTEGILTLLLVPVILVLHRSTFRSVRLIASRVAIGAAAVAIVVVVGFVSVATSNPSYQATAMTNVLATMVQGRIEDPQLAADVRTIDTFADWRILQRYPDTTESMAFWHGAVRPDYEENLPSFRRAVANVILHNPAAFLENRVQVYANANSMGVWLPQVQQAALWETPERQASHDGFTSSSFLVQPVDLEVKNRIERYLLLWTAKRELTPASAVVWNATPGIVALLVVLVLGILRRRMRLWAALSAIVLSNVVAVFLTEPAAYFMYFFPVYLCSGVIVAALVAVAVDRRVSAERAGIERSTAGLLHAVAGTRRRRPRIVESAVSATRARR